MRLVEYKTVEGTIKDPIHIEGEGWFHGWGSELYEMNDGMAVEYTVAIVEDTKDSNVRLVLPTNVRFKNKPIGSESLP